MTIVSITITITITITLFFTSLCDFTPTHASSPPPPYSLRSPTTASSRCCYSQICNIACRIIYFIHDIGCSTIVFQRRYTPEWWIDRVVEWIKVVVDFISAGAYWIATFWIFYRVRITFFV